MTPSTRVSPVPPPAAPTEVRRRSRWLQFSLLAVVLCLLSLVEPRVFQFAIERLVRVLAWREGAEVRIAAVEGSLWQPVVLLDSRWSYVSSDCSHLRVDIERAEGVFEWRDILAKTGRRWFRQLKIEGVTGKLQCDGGAQALASVRVRENDVKRERSWDWLPERVEIRNVNFLAAVDANFIRVVNGSCLLSTIDQGHIQAEQLVVNQPWLTHTFRDVRGTSALQGAKVILAEVTLEPGIQVRSFSADLPDLANGRLDAKAVIAAFDGTLSVQAQTLRSDGEPGLEISIHPSNIRIAPLANFLKLSEAAGGTIQTGRLTFRGSPANPEKATATLRLEATNFQWESRQWNSLVLGATLLNRRLTVPELALHQGANRLNLNGEVELPKTNDSWWNSDFSFNITARLDNLTELSALMLPEFRYVAGKMNIDGSVRGKSQKFDGALIVSGTGITWRNAPIEELHAAVRLNGNEMQVVNLELLNQEDFIRGRGAINILGEKQYWGDVKASIGELAKYEAILRPPIVPEPLAGGGSVTWSGKGSAKGHSGTFSARLQQLRTLGATAAMFHPLSAMLDGSYDPERIDFSRFSLADDESAFSAKVMLGNKALSLAEIRLTHRDEVWLEGNAILPLDFRRAWPTTSPAALLTDGVASKVDLVAKNLQLRGASRLTGWKWPIEGVVNGSIKAEGPIGAVQSSGTLTLSGGRIPFGWEGDHLGAVDGEISFAGQTLTINGFSCRHTSGSYLASGSIDFTNIRDTQLNLAVRSDDFQFRTFPGLKTAADENVAALLALDLRVAGAASAADVTGTARVKQLRPEGNWDLGTLWSGEPNSPLPPLVSYQTPPYSNWKLAVRTEPEQPTKEAPRDFASSGTGGGEVVANLHLAGTGAQPLLSGMVEITNAMAHVNGTELSIEAARLDFRAHAPRDPGIHLLAHSTVAGEPFFTLVTGTLTHPIRVIDAATPPLVALASASLTNQDRAPSAVFAMDLNLPALLEIEVPVWPAITTPADPPIAAEDPAAPPPAEAPAGPPAEPVPPVVSSAVPVEPPPSPTGL